MFSLLWSEHCAYKHSKKLLRTLPTEGPARRHGPGRERRRGRRRRRPGRARSRSSRTTTRAPSSRSRARPPASAGSCATSSRSARGRSPCSTRCASASPTRERSRYLLDRAVAGIGHYGNSIGVPTVGGEVYFEAPYEDQLPGQRDGARPGAATSGSCAAPRRASATSLVLFGASTGRDGIGGASVLASRRARRRRRGQAPDASRSATRSRRRSCMECSLELLDRGLLVVAAGPRRGGPDLVGASEMASKGEVGLDLDVAPVPLREADMEPFEIMVSESQERMLCVCEPAHGRRGAGASARSGRSTARRSARSPTRGRMRVLRGDEVVGDMPVAALVDDCPLYDLAPAAAAAPLYPAPRRRCAPATDVARRRCSRCWPRRTSPRAARCSSSTTALVQSRTVRRPEEADAAVLAPARRRRPRSPSRSTATAAASPPTPTGARSARCSSARPTSRASAPSRWARPTT